MRYNNSTSTDRHKATCSNMLYTNSACNSVSAIQPSMVGHACTPVFSSPVLQIICWQSLISFVSSTFQVMYLRFFPLFVHSNIQAILQSQRTTLHMLVYYRCPTIEGLGLNCMLSSCKGYTPGGLSSVGRGGVAVSH